MKRTSAIAVASFLLILAGTLLVGCGKTERKTFKLDNVVRVFMNTPGEYSFMVSDTTGVFRLATFREIRHDANSRVLFFEDVPPTAKVYVEWETDASYNTPSGASFTTMPLFYRNLYIHLHSIGEVEGGGWTNRVKQGRLHRTQSGHTHVIQ